MKRGEQGEAPFAGLKVQVDRARARTRIRAEHPGLVETHGESGSWGSAEALRRELFTQAGAARYELRANQVLRWFVPEMEGHDLSNALVLCVQAGSVAARRVASGRSASSR